MKEFIDKLIERLEKEKIIAFKTYRAFDMNTDLGRMFGIEKSIEIINELAEEYKDAEEQGLLLKLSYKVGDVVYYSKEYLTDREVQPYEITNLMISCNKKGEWTKKYSAMRLVDSKTIDDRLDFAFEEIGKTVFLTKNEAEQALAEMKGE